MPRSAETLGMFARYFIELPLDASDLEAALTDEPEGLLQPIARHATHRGDQLLADVGFGDTVRVERSVAIRLRSPVRTSSKTIVPFSWRATGTTGGLFPALEADLEIAALGPAVTQLAISARYSPPLGIVGRMLDRAVLHRVAEATVKDFLDHLGGMLLSVTSVGTPAPGVPAGPPIGTGAQRFSRLGSMPT
jgi:hypothetical protein